MWEHNYCKMNLEINATLLYQLASIQINYSFDTVFCFLVQFIFYFAVIFIL